MSRRIGDAASPFRNAGPPTRDTTCAVIVTYNPDSGFPDRLRRAARIAACVCVIDNASRPESVETILAAVGDGRAVLKPNERNLGVATALNQGVAWAQEGGYSWALLFDQDSLPDGDLLDVYARVWRAAGGSDRAETGSREADQDTAQIAVIGTNYRLTDHGGAAAPAPACVEWFEAESVITSGSAVAVGAFGQVGRFRDELFIDWVDIEWCQRAKLSGWRVLMAADAHMTHRLGEPTEHRLLAHRVTCMNQPPMRRYYYARNFVLVMRSLAARRPAWCARKVGSFFKGALLALLFEKQKARKLGCELLGLFDGVTGRLDRLHACSAAAALTNRAAPSQTSARESEPPGASHPS